MIWIAVFSYSRTFAPAMSHEQGTSMLQSLLYRSGKASEGSEVVAEEIRGYQSAAVSDAGGSPTGVASPLVMETRLARLAAMSLSSQNPLPRRRLLDLTGDELVVKVFFGGYQGERCC